VNRNNNKQINDVCFLEVNRNNNKQI
jgi:hypothetical protein